MMALVFTLCACATASEEIAGRMETLERHYEALHSIEVAPNQQDAKAEKLAELRRLLDEPVSSSDEVNALYTAMDDVRLWLWENAAQRPERAPGEFEETPEQWAVRTPTLTLTIARDDLHMTIMTPEATWRFVPCDDNDVAYGGELFSLRSAKTQQAKPFHTGYSAGMRLQFGGFQKAPGLTLYLTAYVSPTDVTFDIAADEDETGRALEAINWPKSAILPAREDVLTVCPVMQGALIPGNWPLQIAYEGLANSREFYMPWWGHIVDGHGIMTILETSIDAGGVCVHLEGGPTHMTPRWYASLGRLDYVRTLRYVFESDATYVSLAKRYRRYAQEKGRFVSLREKCARTPALASAIGSPIVSLASLVHYVREASMFNTVWFEVNHYLRTFDQITDDLRDLKERGIDRALVHLDGWGFYGYDNAHPDPLPPGYEQGGWDGLRRLAHACREMGYLFTLHDQYRDFYFNSPSYDDRLTVVDLDGERFEACQWCGGKQTVLSPRYAPEYVRRNYDLFAEHDVPIDGALLDVFSPMQLDESAQPGCPVTRADCARYRRECFDLLRARGFIVVTEEPTDYIVDAIDMVHHAPYGQHPHVWAGEEALAIPAPLFSLVYHDAVIVPWDLRDAGVWGIPKGMSSRLHGLLNAGPPYALPFWVPTVPEPFPAEQVLEAAKLAEHCAFLEMTNHEFLNPERTTQRTTFADGTQVTVDFATLEYEIEYGQ